VKILIVTPFMPPNVGGIERFSYELSQALANLGHEITILTGAKDKGSLNGLDIPFGVNPRNIVQIEVRSLFGTIPIPKLSWRNINSFHVVARNRFDLALVQSHVFPISILGIVSVRAVQKVWINHGSSFYKWNIGILDKFSFLLENLQMKIMSTKAHSIYSVSNEGSNWISSVMRRKSGILSNSIPSSFMNIAGKSDINPAAGSSTIRILYVGRLVHNKGADRAIEIFNEALNVLRNKNSAIQIQLEIIGSGPLLETLKQSSGQNIIFHGQIPHDQISAIMSECHVFLYPSTYSEGFPTVFLEAASMGLLIVTTSDIPGILHFSEGRACVASPLTNLSKDLSEILSNLQMLDEMRSRAKAIAIENYSWESNVPKFLRELSLS
jgi:glycosyltransferase involved in cell wall biosynthesis